MVYSQTIKKFSEGDELAFKKIYYEHYNNIYRLANYYLKSDDEAVDVVADVFLTLWINRANFETTQHLTAFILTCVRNKSFNILRHKKRADRKIRKVEEALYGDYFVIDPYKEYKIIEDEQVLALIYKMAEDLSIVYKSSFFMFYSDGESVIAIAEHLNIRRQNVYYHLHEAIKYLKLRISWLPYKIIRDN